MDQEIIEQENEQAIEQEVTQEAETQEETQTEESQEQEDSGEVVISFGEEQSQEDQEAASAPAWVKQLRQDHREMKRRNKELEAALAAKEAANAPAPKLGPKPQLSDDGIDYDAEAFETALSKWYEQKRVVDEEAAKIARKQQEEQEAWAAKVKGYEQAKTALRVPDYSDAELAVQDALSVTQQGIILQGLDNPAMLVYAIGKNPAKLKELAAITDPVKYAVAIGKLETQLKVTSKSKTAPSPERTIRGDGGTAGAVDSQLDRLRAEAEKTGDYSKVMAFKRQQQLKKN